VACRIRPRSDSTLKGVQLLCQRNDRAPAFPAGTFLPAYLTAANLCPAKAVAPSDPYSGLSPVFLCSNLLPTSASSYRIAGLEGGSTYSVGVVAVDRLGNASALSGPAYATTLPPAYATTLLAARGCSCVVGNRRSPADHAAAWLLVAGVAFAVRLRRRGRFGPPRATRLDTNP
jgi:MYXO-CTERM domain-containing protein